MKGVRKPRSFIFGILILAIWQRKLILCHSRARLHRLMRSVCGQEGGNPLSKRIKSSVEPETIKEKFKVISIYPFILIFSGALSNLLDRARFGYVIDFIEIVPLKGFFNLADCAIVIGILMIILKILIKQKVLLILKIL